MFCFIAISVPQEIAIVHSRGAIQRDSVNRPLSRFHESGTLRIDARVVLSICASAS